MSQVKAQVWFTLALRTPPHSGLCTSADKILKHITRNITRQRVSPEQHVAARNNASLSTVETWSIADHESTSNQGDAGMIDELEYVMASMNDHDVTWGSDQDSVLQERVHQPRRSVRQTEARYTSLASARIAETAKTIVSSQQDVVGASSDTSREGQRQSRCNISSDTTQGNGEDPPVGSSRRAPRELINWEPLPRKYGAEPGSEPML